MDVSRLQPLGGRRHGALPRIVGGTSPPPQEYNWKTSSVAPPKSRLCWARGRPAATIDNREGEDAAFVTGRLEFYVTFQLQLHPYHGGPTAPPARLL